MAKSEEPRSQVSVPGSVPVEPSELLRWQPTSATACLPTFDENFGQMAIGAERIHLRDGWIGQRSYRFNRHAVLVPVVDPAHPECFRPRLLLVVECAKPHRVLEYWRSDGALLDSSLLSGDGRLLYFASGGLQVLDLVDRSVRIISDLETHPRCTFAQTHRPKRSRGYVRVPSAGRRPATRGSQKPQGEGCLPTRAPTGPSVVAARVEPFRARACAVASAPSGRLDASRLGSGVPSSCLGKPLGKTQLMRGWPDRGRA